MAEKRVRNNPRASRYELFVDDELTGVAEYREHDGLLVFPHTEISWSRRGQGLGEILVRGALDDVRRRAPAVGVVPRCWFVAQFIDENPEYAELLAA